MIVSYTWHTSFLSCHFFNTRNIILTTVKHFRQSGYRPFSSTKEIKIKDIKTEWKGVVGLEIHAQISSASKLFSGAATDFAAPVNTNVSLFDAAIPGTLPVLNRRCIEAGVLTALALSCTLNPVSLFDRKHYFYADLPVSIALINWCKLSRLIKLNISSAAVAVPAPEDVYHSCKQYIEFYQPTTVIGPHSTEKNQTTKVYNISAGYQITQQRVPLAHSGELNFHVSSPDVQGRSYPKKARIKQLQLEQDSGKSLHDIEAYRSLVDLNRAGIPLMEIVFEPDLKTGDEAAALIKELIIILQRLGTCSCKMEEGSLRVDANVSVHRDFEPLGVRTEVKNIGSVRGVAHAIQYEIERQIETLTNGGIIINETRAWDDIGRQTVPMRDKEEKQDYRFMPEPNLPPLRLVMDSDATGSRVNENLVNVNELKKQLPELPAETRKTLISKFGLSQETAIRLVNENVLLEHFSSIMKKNGERDPKLTANILMNELVTVLNKNKLPLETSVSSQSVGEVVDLLKSEKINLMSGRKLLQDIVDGNPNPPSKLIEMHGLLQITNISEIDKLCIETLEQNPKLVEQFLTGKTKVFNALVGKVAKATNNRANMSTVVEMLTNKLNNLKSLKKKVT